MVRDTVLEKNNPDNLDLSKHQLFIDTTGNSQFYQTYLTIQPDKDVISSLIDQIPSKCKLNQIENDSFPRLWISLKKLDNEFVIYHPCDGSTPSIAITENIMIFNNQLEPDVSIICSVERINRTIRFTLSSILEESELIIEPTTSNNIYKILYNAEEWFATTRERVAEFKIVVNHCPKVKMTEFSGFDKE